MEEPSSTAKFFGRDVLISKEATSPARSPTRTKALLKPIVKWELFCFLSLMKNKKILWRISGTNKRLECQLLSDQIPLSQTKCVYMLSNTTTTTALDGNLRGFCIRCKLPLFLLWWTRSLFIRPTSLSLLETLLPHSFLLFLSWLQLTSDTLLYWMEQLQTAGL